MGAGAQKPAFWRKAGSAEATWPLAESWRHAGGCPRTPKSAMESHLGFAESSRVHEPLPTSQFAAVAALPPRNNSLRYTYKALLQPFVLQRLKVDKLEPSFPNSCIPTDEHPASAAAETPKRFRLTSLQNPQLSTLNPFGLARPAPCA